MPHYALLISPRAEGAFFAQALDVAKAELAMLDGLGPAELVTHGDMHFLVLDAPEDRLRDLLRLACVQGAFGAAEGGLAPLGQTAGFRLHPDFVWGEKYRGKTNETLTQLLINVALQTADLEPDTKVTLLDPMCGRGTTLLWAMRYGIRATGVEQDRNVHRDLTRGLKKWTKLHRQKHKITEGWTQKANKKGAGKYLEFAAESTSLRVITGDTVNTHDLTQRKSFNLLATDLPYGIEHRGPGEKRSVLETVEAAAPGWAASLAPGGVMAIAYNANLPKPAALRAAFDGLGLTALDLGLSHRMSESILRDVLVLKKT